MTGRGGTRDRSRPHGATLGEVLLCVALFGLLTATSVPALLAGRDAYLASRAARHLGAALGLARSQAIASGRQVAVRFLAGAPDAWEVCTDGNRNGVRAAEVDSGVDPTLGPRQTLAALAPQVRFGVVPGVIDVDSGAALNGNPIRVAGAMVSFSPTGASSSGTVYLAGPGLRQHAVRVLGASGRIRVLRFDERQRVWTWP